METFPLKFKKNVIKLFYEPSHNCLRFFELIFTYEKNMLRSGGKLRSGRPTKRARTSSFRRPMVRQGAFIMSRPVMSEKVPYFFKLRQRLTGYLTSSGAGAMTQFVYTNDPSSCTDWTSLSALFDQYKVLRVKLTIIPKYVDAWPLGTGGNFGTLCVRYDSDSITAPATVDEAIQYDNNRIFRLDKVQKYYCKNLTQTDNSVANSGMQQTYKPGYGLILDVAQVANYHKGNIGWYGDGFTFSTNYADLIAEYTVLFFNRR